MKIQSINALQTTKPSFQRAKLNKIAPKVQKQLTFREEMERNYTRGIVAALVIIAGMITAYVVREHKNNNTNKVQTEEVRQPDAQLKNAMDFIYEKE